MSSHSHNVIVDSGEVCEELVSVVERIRKNKEVIDLLVISHYDSDHIKAICDILYPLSIEERHKLLKKVWFNATKAGFCGNEKNWSETDATLLGNMLLEADIPWVSKLQVGMVEKISSELSIDVIGGGEIYTQAKTGKALNSNKCDWRTSLSELELYLNDDAKDSSKTNEQSAILVVHANSHDILLPGDTTPAKFLIALNEVNKNGIASFDLVKLPHHGSYKNVTKDILSRIKCNDYVITTNGSEFSHPNKKTFLKVVKWSARDDDSLITFHLNYFDLSAKLGFTEDEKKQYKFDIDGKRTFEF